ncbi:hypothetical protein M1P56_21250 [Streptomyces sp. HU2014]|uniref:hypothetical protein n=1 Tax=Streptomyces sp. HU2014 TaxID=2939414 RepID=UPI00200DEBE8|nr:hypothetical protein [Streptomyces sp. HU2014]UQI46695.1 hypothetical protein M1P56_21250 [Streptomyces sp. HU2014]
MAEQPNEEEERPVNWVDPKQAHIVEHFRREVAEAIRSGKRGCTNCHGLGKIIMVVNGKPENYSCSCGG